MITQIEIDSTVITNNKRYCTGLDGLAFPVTASTLLRRGSFAGSKVVQGQPQGFKLGLEFVLISSSFSDLVTQRDAFLEVLGGILTAPKTLKITRSDSTNVQIDVSGISVKGYIDAEDGNSAKLYIDMLTEYPYLQSVVEYTTDLTIFSGGGMAIPMIIPMDMSDSGSGEETLTNAGNANAYPTIKFYGPLTNPSLLNVTTGEQISINYTLTNISDYIEVDTFNRTVTLHISGSVTNGRQYASGEFPILAPGENIMRLISSSFSSSAQVEIIYRDHFLNV